MKTKLILLTLTLSFLGTASIVRAEDKSDGCGLGLEVTKKQTLLATTTRATTNAYFPPSFSMTSGTSHCAQHSLVKKKEIPAVDYAMANYEPLMVEMAQGKGEYIDGFAKAFGCKDSAKQTFAKVTQQGYKNLIQNDGQAMPGFEMFKEVRQQIQSNKELSSKCGA